VLIDSKHNYGAEYGSSNEENKTLVLTVVQQETTWPTDWINYHTTYIDFQHFPYTLQNDGPQAHTAWVSRQKLYISFYRITYMYYKKL